MSENENRKYYIFSFLAKSDNNCHYSTHLLYFKSSNIINGYKRVKYKDKFCSYTRKISSCFETYPLDYTFCFFQNDVYQFMVYIYNTTLNLDTLYSNYIDIGIEEEGNENIFLNPYI